MEYELSKYIKIIKNKIDYRIQYTTINKEIVINESICDFLEKLNKLSTLEKVLNTYTFKTEEIENSLNEVLNYFINLGIIVKKGQEGIAIDYKVRFNVNEKIDNYNVISVISNRKTGELYKVIDKNDNEFALKTIRLRKFPNTKTYNKALLSFEKENSYGSNLSNTYLCKIFKGVFEKDWGAYYIMELINGEPISNIKNIRKLKIKVKINIFKQILTGFDYIHSVNMLHGDLHLNNILIDKDLNIKIIDYGLVSNLIDDKTQNGGVCEFIPPERMSEDIIEKFKSKNTIKAEIYQLGIIYYFILTARLPFTSKTWKTIYNEKISFDDNYLKKTNLISIRNLQILNKCLSPNPDNRFSTIKEIIEIL